jgi:hypothetical protein
VLSFDTQSYYGYKIRDCETRCLSALLLVASLSGSHDIDHNSNSRQDHGGNDRRIRGAHSASGNGSVEAGDAEELRVEEEPGREGSDHAVKRLRMAEVRHEGYYCKLKTVKI